MQNQNVVAIVRTAYEAYGQGDLETMLGFVDPDLEWTHLDPSLEAPEPKVCHGWVELENALAVGPSTGSTPSSKRSPVTPIA